MQIRNFCKIAALLVCGILLTACEWKETFPFSLFGGDEEESSDSALMTDEVEDFNELAKRTVVTTPQLYTTTLAQTTIYYSLTADGYAVIEKYESDGDAPFDLNGTLDNHPIIEIKAHALYGAPIHSYTQAGGNLYLREAALYACPQLELILLNGCTVLFSVDSVAASGLTQLLCEDCSVNIDEEAFSECKMLTNFSIIGRDTAIATHAFSGCTQIDSMTLSQTKLTAEESAFLADSIFRLNIFQCTLNLQPHCFNECGAFNVDIQDCTGDIPAYAFGGCTNSISICIEGENPIREFAFAYLKRHIQIELDERIPKIDETAFRECENVFLTLHTKFCPAGTYAILHNLRYHLVES